MSYSSYRRAVTCSYCYRQGHNKRGCTRYKTDAAEGKVSSYHKLAPRRCSYCAKTGHDRRKCEDLHNDKVNTILSNRKWIELVIKDMEDNGVGIGTLLKIKDHHYGDGGQFNLAMITGFNWDNLFIKHPTKAWVQIKNYYGSLKKSFYQYEGGFVSFKDAHCPQYPNDDTSNWRSMNLESSIKHSKKITVVTPVTQDLTKIAPPAVLNGGVGMEDWFLSRTSDEYHRNKEYGDI